MEAGGGGGGSEPPLVLPDCWLTGVAVAVGLGEGEGEPTGDGDAEAVADGEALGDGLGVKLPRVAAAVARAAIPADAGLVPPFPPSRKMSSAPPRASANPRMPSTAQPAACRPGVEKNSESRAYNRSIRLTRSVRERPLPFTEGQAARQNRYTIFVPTTPDAGSG